MRAASDSSLSYAGSGQLPGQLLCTTASPRMLVHVSAMRGFDTTFYASVAALVRSSQACCHVLMTELELTNAWPNAPHTD